VAILPILTAPHPVLESKAREVQPAEFGPDLQRFLDDMAETMYDAPGVGLAAPQVGDARRIIVVDSGEEGGSGLLKMVNPVIAERSKEILHWNETCLSVPDLEVKVERSKRVLVRWVDAFGNPNEREFQNFEAVIVQHELDHLIGTVLLDRVSRFRKSRYMQDIRKRKAARKSESSAAV
jgi:peptide deformylase